jgi:RNA polymerase subunit RPABC4/transcription elongation factor Spt4
MKCKFCHAEIDSDSKFCTNCGRDLSKLRRCVNCHEIIDDDSEFCPYCGSKQPDVKVCPNCGSYLDISVRSCVNCGYSFYREEETPSFTNQSEHVISADEPQEIGKGSNKLLWVALVLILCAGLAGGYFFFSQKNKGAKADVVRADTVINESGMTSDEEAEWLNQRAEKNTESAQALNEGYDETLSERKLSESDVEGLTSNELTLKRNSIYARHGYRFKRDDLFNHFSQFPWYSPSTSDMAEVYNRMSDIEQYNVDFIKRHE